MTHQIPCPKCGSPLRHRVLSNLRWCANSECPDYRGRPPIKVLPVRFYNLYYAMGDRVWRKVEEDIARERGEIGGT